MSIKGGGGGRLMDFCILNFHFVLWITFLILSQGCQKKHYQRQGQRQRQESQSSASIRTNIWACSELIAKDCGLQRSLFHHTCWNIRAITLEIDCTAKLALCYKFWRELIVLEQVFFSGQISWWLTRFQRPGGLLSLGLVLVFSGWWSVGTRMCDNTAPPT